MEGEGTLLLLPSASSFVLGVGMWSAGYRAAIILHWQTSANPGALLSRLSRQLKKICKYQIKQAQKCCLRVPVLIFANFWTHTSRSLCKKMANLLCINEPVTLLYHYFSVSLSSFHSCSQPIVLSSQVLTWLVLFSFSPPSSPHIKSLFWLMISRTQEVTFYIFVCLIFTGVPSPDPTL